MMILERVRSKILRTVRGIALRSDNIHGEGQQVTGLKQEVQHLANLLDMYSSRKLDFAKALKELAVEVSHQEDKRDETQKEHIGDAPQTGWEEAFSVKDFWEKCHEMQSVTQLTGSHGEGVWRDLCASERVTDQARVLNIGVGLGHCTKALSQRVKAVHALDISEKALNNVKSFVEKTWLAQDIEKLPNDTFDLAISNLVAQHMNDRDLMIQFKEVIRSLKPSGIFAIQIAYPFPSSGSQSTKQKVNRGEINESNGLEKSGSVVRHLYEVAEMVDRANGVVTFMKAVSEYPRWGSAWYILHIMKKAQV